MRIGPRIAIAMAIGLAIGIATNNMFNGLLLGFGFAALVAFAIIKQRRTRLDDD